jgi:hypothetical protein
MLPVHSGTRKDQTTPARGAARSASTALAWRTRSQTTGDDT